MLIKSWGISITGIGLPLLPNSLLDVKIFAQDSLIHERRLISSGNEDTDIEPINFQNPIEISGTYPNMGKVKITIQIKGHGELRFGCRRLNRDYEDYEGWVKNNMHFSRKNGLVENLAVFIKTEDKGILAELYMKPLDKDIKDLM